MSDLTGRKPIRHAGAPDQRRAIELSRLNRRLNLCERIRPGRLSADRRVPCRRVRNRRRSGDRLSHWSRRHLSHPIRHCEAHAESHPIGSATAGVLGRGHHRVPHLILLELVHVADDTHARPRVERLLDRFGERHVDDEELRNVQPVFVVDPLGNQLAKFGSHLLIVSRQVERGDLLRPQHVGERLRDD